MATATGGSSGAGAGSGLNLPVLPPAFAASVMPLGDSQTSGFVALGGQPSGTMYAVGADGTGTWRRWLYDLVYDHGVVVPNFQWLKGTFESSDPNGSGGGNARDHHQGQAGATLTNLNSSFPGWWASAPAASIVLMAGTNDWATYLMANPGDYSGAATFAATNLGTLLATIKSVAGPSVVVGVVTPPTGFTHKTEALLTVPLYKTTVATAVAGGQKAYLLADATTAFSPTSTGSSLMCSDDVHVNEIGQKMLAGLIFRGMLSSPF